MSKNGVRNKLNKFSSKDEMIRKAFKIYSERDLENSMGDFEFEYDDDKIFEDKIYSVINKLPIKNPRSKAHIIYIAVICLVLFLGLIIGYIYMGSRKQAGETNVLEDVCKSAKARYDLSKNAELMNLIIKKSDDLESEEEQKHDQYNRQNTAVYVDTNDYSKGGYLYSFYQMNDDEVKKLTEKGVELKKAGRTEKLTPFLENATEKSQYSKGSIYFIDGRSSRRFIVFKNRTDDMYIGKCVGFESLKEHDILSDKKLKNKILAGVYFENIMDIKNSDGIREIMFERAKEKSKEEPEKRLAVWVSDESKSELYNILTKGNSIKMGFMVKYHFAFEVEDNPERCYYIAVENKESELCILGVILGKKNVEVYVEPEYKAGCALKLSAENAKKLKELIRKNDK